LDRDVAIDCSDFRRRPFDRDDEVVVGSLGRFDGGAHGARHVEDALAGPFALKPIESGFELSRPDRVVCEC
jgi:hypothetical protein